MRGLVTEPTQLTFFLLPGLLVNPVRILRILILFIGIGFFRRISHSISLILMLITFALVKDS